MPAARNIQFDFVTYPQNESAWILHTPSLIWDHQLSFKISGRTVDLQRHDERNGMVAAVNAKSPVDLNLRVTLRRERSRHLGWGESGIGILLALQNVGVHPPIALAVAALPAFDVNYDQSGRNPVCRIEVNHPTLEGEGSMHRVEHVCEREFDLGIRGIQCERHLLCPQGARTTHDAENRHEDR